MAVKLNVFCIFAMNFKFSGLQISFFNLNFQIQKGKQVYIIDIKLHIVHL